MCLIGNDLIHLKKNLSTFSRKGVENLILSKSEFDFISNNYFSLSLAWSIKESIYKITCKQGNLKAFTPSKIIILSINNKNNFIYGVAKFENYEYYYNASFNNYYIYAYAATLKSELNNIIHLFFNNDRNNNNSLQNNNVNSFLRKKGWNLFHNKNGIPQINQRNNVEVSITHDYNILALCYFAKQIYE